MNSHMNQMDALAQLIERVAALPQEAQAEFVDLLADVVDHFKTKHAGLYRLSEDERQGIERGLREMRELRFAPDDAVAAVFRRARSAGACEAGLQDGSPGI
jgi:hypothetical protein